MIGMLTAEHGCLTCQLHPATFGTPPTVAFHVGSFGLIGFCPVHAADYQTRLAHWYEQHLPPAADPWPTRNAYLALCQALQLTPHPWW